MKKLFIILCAVSIISTLSFVVFAHPGKTDSSGGHFDSSTGDYHYHHGYPAHQHYDKDGDGIADCMYSFDDQTDHSPGNASQASTTPKKYPDVEIEQPNIPPSNKTDAFWGDTLLEIIISIIFGILLLGFVLSVFSRKAAELCLTLFYLLFSATIFIYLIIFIVKKIIGLS